MAESDNAGILFALTNLSESVNTLRGEVQGGLGEIRGRLDSKADSTDITEINARLDRMMEVREQEQRRQETRVSELERWRHELEVTQATHAKRDAGLLTKRQRIWAAVYGTLTLLALTLGPVLDHLVTH